MMAPATMATAVPTAGSSFRRRRRLRTTTTATGSGGASSSARITNGSSRGGPETGRGRGLGLGLGLGRGRRSGRVERGASGPAAGLVEASGRRRRRDVGSRSSAVDVGSASDAPEPSSSSSSSSSSEGDANIDVWNEFRSLVAFCAPLLASNIISPLLTMTDTAFVGRCTGEASATALAALGVSTPLTDYTVTLFAFITAGLTSIVSRGVASKEDEDELNGKVYGALFIAAVSSVLVAIMLLVRTDALLDTLKVSGEVKAIASSYTRIRGLAMPAAFMTAASYATLVARKDTVRPLLCVALAAVVNLVGDWLMVAVFKTGAVGAAWATTLSLYTGLVAITVVLHRQNLLNFPPRQNFNGGSGLVAWLRALIPTKAQVAPVMAFFGPITFLVGALLTIYTTQILMANSLGVTVSAAHRIAANLFSFTVLCGDPLVQAGQAFMPEYIIRPVRANARKMAMILFQFGLFAASVASFAFAASCLFGAGVFTTDASVINQLRSVVLPMSAAVSANILSKSLYGVMVAARALNFLAGLTAVGLVGFCVAMSIVDARVVGLAKYACIWWITFAYYGLASLVLFCRINGFGFRSVLADDDVDQSGRLNKPY